MDEEELDNMMREMYGHNLKTTKKKKEKKNRKIF